MAGNPCVDSSADWRTAILFGGSASDAASKAASLDGFSSVSVGVVNTSVNDRLGSSSVSTAKLPSMNKASALSN